MVIIASEIITICTPMGRPLPISVRTSAMSGRNSARSPRPIHSGWRRLRSHSSRAVRLMALATSVARAEPLMPSAGTGPQPKMNSGFSAVSSTTTSTRNMNGVRESPAPRSTACTKANRYSSGMARKISCR